MIRILVVDDNGLKARKIEDAVYQILDPGIVALETVGDTHSAGMKLRAREYDLLVLDLNVPLRDGEEAKPQGGILLLEQLSRRPDWNAPRHVLGLTAYDGLAAEHASVFARDLWHVVRFDGASTEWVDTLGRQLIHILQEKTVRSDAHGVDLAIVTALFRVELESVLELPADWSRAEMPGDHAIYFRGTFRRDDRSVSVVAAACSEMGMPAATALSMKVIEHFHPRVLAMCGIAAGVNGHFGDVLVADQSWDYGSGKRKSVGANASIFLPAPSYIALDQLLRARINYFALDAQLGPRIAARWRERVGALPEHVPEVRMGPVASGAAVLQSRDAVDEIVSHNRKVVGVEMETYGVFMAARECKEPRPKALSVKAICDFGDSAKGDEYQKYAAFTSAQFLYEFALEHFQF